MQPLWELKQVRLATEVIRIRHALRPRSTVRSARQAELIGSSGRAHSSSPGPDIGSKRARHDRSELEHPCPTPKFRFALDYPRTGCAYLSKTLLKLTELLIILLKEFASFRPRLCLPSSAVVSDLRTEFHSSPRTPGLKMATHRSGRFAMYK